MTNSHVTRNIAEERYELALDGDVAVAIYRERNDVVSFIHTAVPETLEGHGVATRLIAGALDDVRRRNLKIVPECRFVAGYVQRHPEVQDLLAS